MEFYRSTSPGSPVPAAAAVMAERRAVAVGCSPRSPALAMEFGFAGLGAWEHGTHITITTLGKASCWLTVPAVHGDGIGRDRSSPA